MLVNLSKGIAAYPNKVVFTHLAVSENLGNRTGNDQIIIAEKPNVFSTGLLKTLKEVRIAPYILSIPQVAKAKPLSHKVLYKRRRLIRRSIVRDDQLNPMLILKLPHKHGKKVLQTPCPVVGRDRNRQQRSLLLYFNTHQRLGSSLLELHLAREHGVALGFRSPFRVLSVRK